jgi:hypothetical protein
MKNQSRNDREVMIGQNQTRRCARPRRAALWLQLAAAAIEARVESNAA